MNNPSYSDFIPGDVWSILIPRINTPMIGVVTEIGYGLWFKRDAKERYFIMHTEKDCWCPLLPRLAEDGVWTYEKLDPEFYEMVYPGLADTIAKSKRVIGKNAFLSDIRQ